MKKVFFNLVVAILFLTSCVNAGKEKSVDTDIVSTETSPPLPPPPPVEDAVVEFSSMETPPKYPGGYSAFYKFIGDNLKYPEIAKENKVEGSVLASFIIEKDGSLSNILIDKKELESEFEEEAIRVLKLTKKWEPGISNGKIVRVKYQIPIKFFLN